MKNRREYMCNANVFHAKSAIVRVKILFGLEGLQKTQLEFVSSNPRKFAGDEWQVLKRQHASWIAGLRMKHACFTRP